MDSGKLVEGFIPEGLVVSNLHGEAGGILTISGVVERSDIRVKKLIISSSGKVRNGSVEAEHVIIEGCATGVLFRTARLQVFEKALISDCVIVMKDATGFSMHEGACFEGDIKLTTSRQENFSLIQPDNITEGFSSMGRTAHIEHAEIEADIPLGD